MKIEIFTEEDIKGAAELAYPIWGIGHADSGRGKEFGVLMCEYIVRYGWYGAPYAFKMVDDSGKMLACILAGKITQKNGYDDWLETQMPTFNANQKEEAQLLRSYFRTTGPKVYAKMTAEKDLYLSFFISSVPGCGKLLLRRVVELAVSEGYKNLYLWTDSSCNHDYYAHHQFEKVEEFKSDEWKIDSNDYLTYIYKKTIG